MGFALPLFVGGRRKGCAELGTQDSAPLCDGSVLGGQYRLVVWDPTMARLCSRSRDGGVTEE